METCTQDPQTGRFISTIPISERFWQKVQKTDTCWLYIGAVSKNGYGVFWNKSVASGSISAHRFSYELSNGPIPKGMAICHTCDVRRCINPDHLFLGTLSDNVQDMIHKGRQVIGNRARKLTPEQVREMRKLQGHLSLKIVGKRYGISPSAVRKIFFRELYAHVPD